MQLIESDVPTSKPSAESKSKNQAEGRKERLKNHKLTPTCICIDSKNEFAFTASKDGSIIKWCLESRKILAKVHSISKRVFDSNEELKKQRHHKHINCIAISSNDEFLATGGSDKLIRIYSPEDLSWIHTFEKHKAEITALAFRMNHSLLYSGSADRALLSWTLEDEDNRVFVDDLYGHESAITSMDILKKERVLTSGGRDQTIRIWKIVEQAQTVFESDHQSVDIARYIDEQMFVSGGEDGSICVWTTMKRKPLVKSVNAHPIRPNLDKKDANGRCYRYDEVGLKSWISALATFSFKERLPALNQDIGKKKRKLNDGQQLVTEGVPGLDSDETSEEEDEDSDSAERLDQDMDETTEPSSRKIALVASGSCNNEVKLWTLVKSGSNHELILTQTFECAGFINDLRFTNDGKKLLAVCGPENKFGRWWRLVGVKCSMRVFDLRT